MAPKDEVLEDVAGRIAANGINLVRMMLVDLHGIARAKQVTAEYFLEVARSGHTWATPLLAVDLIQDFGADVEIGLDNAPLIPDLSTFAELPWRPGTAHVICDAALDAEVVTARASLRKVVDDARALGYVASVGNEIEFYVYRPDGGGFTSDIDIREWYSDQALGIMAPLLEALNSHLQAVGVPVYEIFNEHGAGQFELNMRPGGPLESADRIFVAKAAIKEIARMHGLRATFMTKPDNDPGVVPSGFHVHQTIGDLEGNNLFRSEGEAALTGTGLNYVAGQLAHAGALTAFAAQTVNAYKRFTPGTWAPLTASWSVDHRGTMVRAIPAGANTRVENRLGASDANPYLIVASQLASGILGVREGLRPPPPQPLRGSSDPSAATMLPGTLIEAVQALESDAALGAALGSRFVSYYAAMLRNEFRRFQLTVTDWEIQEYREIV